MSLITSRLSQIKPSPTLAISEKARELIRQGQDVISLSAGEPDFDTPTFVKQAAVNAIWDGATKYTAVGGSVALREAIARKFARENGLKYELDEIISSVGAKHILYNALMATLNPGDEVIIPAPYWVSYPDMVTLAGGESVIVPTSEGQGFKLTPAQLDAAITPKTKWLVLNSPGNPTGSAYTETELKALGEVLLKYPQVYVLSDDIYEHILYDGLTFNTLAHVVPKLKSRVLTINGVSKAYAMTGWRIGYAGGPKEIIKAMTKIQSQSTSNPCSIAQAAAIAALDGDQRFLQERTADFQHRRDVIVKGINAIEGLSCLSPEGAFYIFVNVSSLIRQTPEKSAPFADDLEVTKFLLEKAMVAVVPGSAFGAPGFVRLSYATSLELIEKALLRIDQAVSTL